MKILVTGTTGFVGHHVLNELLKYDHEIIAAVRDKGSVKELQNKGIKLVSLDLDNLDLTKNYFLELDKPDLLIHLAWQGLPNYKEQFHLDKNLPAHQKFLENIIQNGLNQLVVTGTCFEYGMKEGCLSEEMQSAPQNAYAIAKDELRNFLEDLKKQHSYSLKWVRLFYMYGEGQNLKSLLSQLQNALKNGEQVFNMSGGEQQRDYLPIEKVAEYIVKISVQNKIDGIINCCSGKPIKVKTLVENFLTEKNRKIELNLGYYPYPDYEPMAFWGDNTKLKNLVNE